MDLEFIVQNEGCSNPKQLVDKIIQILEKKGFVPENVENRSIHSALSSKFMSEILNAEPYVLDIASRGVDLGVSIDNET